MLFTHVKDILVEAQSGGAIVPHTQEGRNTLLASAPLKEDFLLHKLEMV